jgi:hypothetical protein
MPTLEAILEQIEQDLTTVLMDTFTTLTFGPLTKVYTSPPEEGTTAQMLPLAAIFVPSIEAEDDDTGVICSESAMVSYEIYLQALKPVGRTVAAEKRQRAQQIRSAIKNATIRHASLILWMGDTYELGEDSRLEALSTAYTIRVSYQMRVEWED